MLLLRVRIPDRPGSLGQVATAMGTVGADIWAIEIVEKSPDGTVTDDFMLSLPANVMPDSLVAACTALPGVEVTWVSLYPDTWGIESDLEVLDDIAANPRQGLQTLTLAAPRVFHCQWAVLAELRDGTRLQASELAPELTREQLNRLVPLDQLHRQGADDTWLPGWGDMELAVAPLRGNRLLILGRQGGPRFLDSELLRLRHLSGIAA
ncbi:MAG: amino acid-binding protein [Propionibacteriaceae bacterium]|jgi:hypothetical protein|nr:amino acid-binding protein [Propionibacteriaceae bacterium]